MKLNADDPRLTAYALGEMSEEERAEFEAELKDSPEGRAQVEEVRKTARWLERDLAAEELPGLSMVQRQTIERQLRPVAEQRRLPIWKVLIYGGLSAAGLCLIGFAVLPLWSNSKGNTEPPVANQQLAKLTKTSESRTDSELPRPAETAPSPTAVSSQTAPIESAQNPATGYLGTVSTNFSNPSGFDRRSQQPDDWNALAHNESPNPSERNLSVNQGFAPTASPAIRPPLIMNSGSLVVDNSGNRVMNGGSASEPAGIELSLSREAQERNKALLPSVKENNLAAPDSAIQKVTDGSPKGTSTQPLTTRTLGSSNEKQEGSPVVLQVLPIHYGDASDLIHELDATAAASQSATYPPGSVGSANAQSEQSLGDTPMVGRLFRPADGLPDTATYPHLVDNSFLTARNSPLSTFSVDVDSASYSNVRRFLNAGQMPPPDAVRIEELINYFSYHYPQPRGEVPFSVNIEVAGCPWNPEHRLVRVGIKGREIAQDKRPPSNFVFLIDVSGSMEPSERLPLIKQALRQLVMKMTGNDRVAIVVYASKAGVKLESTSCAEKDKILAAIDALEAEGSTNGGDGIQQAYRVAEENFIKGGVNRVLLCTDGDFNVGMTDQGDLVRMIQQKARSGVALTTLGVGTDNYKDALMQQLADKGNGNYYYLDSQEEAQKVLIDQMSGTLVTIAKDVKIQIEFNPAQVNAYRLIGYEKRLLRKEDFNNDAKDAGEIGAGHTVTALYEIVPAGKEVQVAVDDLKYQRPVEDKPERYVTTGSKELLTLKLRYQEPDGNRSRLLEFPVTDGGRNFDNASTDFKFASAVASFGMLLRDSEFKGDTSYGAVLEWAEGAKGADENGYRSEFLNLVRKAAGARRHDGF